MKKRSTNEWVKQSLDAHAAIGLTIGALMYFVCLTGTLATLAESFERWEQPGMPEYRTLDAQATTTAVEQYREISQASPNALWLVFPTDALPRMHVSDGESEWYTDVNGSFVETVHAPWTEMLRALHMRLHLPQTVGFFLVSSLGAMLIALILSGVLAHPRIFKDAFKLRLGGSKRLEQADIHNRLSVWGLPFHLMIAFTGAFYGLVGVLVFSAATLFYDGDEKAVFDAIYGSDPVMDAPITAPDTAAAMRSLQAKHPEVEPIYLAIQNLDTRQQLIEIAATVPGRLAYSEIYRFDASGTYLGDQALTSGPVGRQFLYSLYRVHFGYFGPYATRIVWFALGLVLTIVSASGVNIWLSRRGYTSWVNDAWPALVWGSPLALAIAALLGLFVPIDPLAVTLLVLAIIITAVIKKADAAASRLQLIILLGAALGVLAMAHWLNATAGISGAAPHAINAALLLGGALFCAWGLWQKRSSASQFPQVANSTAS